MTNKSVMNFLCVNKISFSLWSDNLLRIITDTLFSIVADIWQ